MSIRLDEQRKEIILIDELGREICEIGKYIVDANGNKIDTTNGTIIG